MLAQQISLIDLTESSPTPVSGTSTAPVLPTNADDIDTKIQRHTQTIQRLIRAGNALFLSVSFGKDSSVMLALTIHAMMQLREAEPETPLTDVFVLHSNTGVENPVLEQHAMSEIVKLEAFAAQHQLPITVELAQPTLANGYLVNLIGGKCVLTTALSGRQCSQDLKVVPITRAKNKILKQLGNHYGNNVVTLLGKRFDESTSRKTQMIERGENPTSPVDINGQQVLCSIADWSLDDIYWLIAKVRNYQLGPMYSDFDSLLSVYRSINEGSCMIFAVEDGSASPTPCGSGRGGCWICAAVSKDAAMQSILSDPDNDYSHLKRLSDLRDYMVYHHDNPDKRCWLSRSINDDGSITIAPNAYSPEHCESLLKFALSIQADELHDSEGRPRFSLLALEEVLAIGVYWSRYGYNYGHRALEIWYEIYVEGQRYYPPVYDSTSPFPTLNAYPKGVRVPFTDEHHGDLLQGVRNPSAALVGAESLKLNRSGEYTTDLPLAVAGGFSINIEEEYWLYRELIPRWVSEYRSGSVASPCTFFHMLEMLGIVQFASNGPSSYERMLQMSNQLHRLGLRDKLSDPEALCQALGQRPFLPRSARGNEEIQPDLFAPSTAPKAF